jgi:hypothetical protein
MFADRTAEHDAEKRRLQAESIAISIAGISLDRTLRKLYLVRGIRERCKTVF